MVLPNLIYSYALGVMAASAIGFTIQNTYNPSSPATTIYIKKSGLYMAVAMSNVQSYESTTIFYYDSPTNSIYGLGVGGRNPDIEVYTPGINTSIRNIINVSHAATNNISVSFYIYKLTSLQLASMPTESAVNYKNTNQ